MQEGRASLEAAGVRCKHVLTLMPPGDVYLIKIFLSVLCRMGLDRLMLLRAKSLIFMLESTAKSIRLGMLVIMIERVSLMGSGLIARGRRRHYHIASIKCNVLLALPRAIFLSGHTAFSRLHVGAAVRSKQLGLKSGSTICWSRPQALKAHHLMIAVELLLTRMFVDLLGLRRRLIVTVLIHRASSVHIFFVSARGSTRT